MSDPNNPYSLSQDSVQAICEDKSGTLWIGTFGGLNKLVTSPASGGINSSEGADREKEHFIRFVHDQNDFYSISNDCIWSICEDSVSNTMWIATSNGLNRFDRQTGRFTRFLSDPKNPKSLSNNYIWTLFVDHTGRLRIGTASGLNYFDHRTEQFTHFTIKDGLPHDQIMGILEDAHGRLWLSTFKGISCFDPKTKTFRNYDLVDGLISNEFVHFRHRNANGQMFFFGSNGLEAFHPDSINNNSYIPPVVITSFKRYNTDDAEGIAIAEKGISAKKKIQVAYKDNILSFEFAALNYRNTIKNQYAYKLEGFNDNWIQLGTKRDITFTNLDPGEYTLRVKGSNNDGVWNEEGASLKTILFVSISRPAPERPSAR